MAKKKPMFVPGALVRASGRSGVHCITHVVVIPVPTIDDRGQFVLVDTMFYKFVHPGSPEQDFFAYEHDLRLHVETAIRKAKSKRKY